MNKRRNSKRQDITSQPTWRQLTLQKSRIENSSTWKHETKSGPAEADCLDKDEPSDEEVIYDSSRNKLYKRKPSNQSTSSDHKIRGHNGHWSGIKQLEVVKKANVYSIEHHSSAPKYADVRQPKIALIDCVKSLKINVQPPVTATSDFNSPTNKKLRKSSLLNKSAREPNYDEFCSGDSSDGKGTRIAKSGGPKRILLGPTCRQLTKQQSGSLEALNHSVDSESSNQSKTASGGVHKKYNSGSAPKHDVKRNEQESDQQILTIVPTWRQLTKQLSGSSKCQNISKYGESSSHYPKSSNTIIDEAKIKKKIRHLEEAQPQAGSLLQFNVSARKQKGARSRVDSSSELHHKNQKSEVIIRPTWRQLSILSNHSDSLEKSLESYHKNKKSVATKYSNNSTSANQRMLSKVKPISLTAAHLKVPTVQISRLNPHDAAMIREKKSKTLASGKHLNDCTAAKQEILPSNKEIVIAIANIKKAATLNSNCPKPSAPDRSSTSNEQNMTTPQYEIPMHNDEQTGKPESKPSASSESGHIITMPAVQEDKPHYECTMCDYRGSHLGMIWNHILDHKIKDNGVKPYACVDCNYRAKSDQLLRSHQITHAGEKPYPCDLCDRRCRSNTHLRIHKIIHHNEKPFECHGCDFKCADERLFQAHLRNHRFL